MTRADKCVVALEINRLAWVNLFDEDGFLDEERFDKLFEIVRRHVAV